MESESTGENVLKVRCVAMEFFDCNVTNHSA